MLGCPSARIEPSRSVMPLFASRSRNLPRPSSSSWTWLMKTFLTLSSSIFSFSTPLAKRQARYALRLKPDGKRFGIGKLRSVGFTGIPHKKPAVFPYASQFSSWETGRGRAFLRGGSLRHLLLHRRQHRRRNAGVDVGSAQLARLRRDHGADPHRRDRVALLD